MLDLLLDFSRNISGYSGSYGGHYNLLKQQLFQYFKNTIRTYKYVFIHPPFLIISYKNVICSTVLILIDSLSLIHCLRYKCLIEFCWDRYYYCLMFY